MAFKNNSSLDISKLCWQAKWQNGDTRLLHVGFASYVLWINHQHAAALPLCWPNYWQEWGSLKGTWLWCQILKPLWIRWYSDINTVFGGSYCCHFLHALFVPFMGILTMEQTFGVWIFFLWKHDVCNMLYDWYTLLVCNMWTMHRWSSALTNVENYHAWVNASRPRQHNWVK